MQILFITANRLGDAILSTGLLHHLLQTYPDARFTIACGPIAEGVFLRMPRRDRTLIVEKQRFDRHWIALWRQAIPTVWDLVIDLRGSALAYLLRAHRRAVLRGGRHASHKTEQLAAALHLHPAPQPTAWIAPQDHARAATLLPEPHPYIALGPTANWTGKLWPPDRFTALYQALQQTIPNARPVIFAGPGPAERAMAAPVLQALPNAIDLAGQLTLPEASACLARCALFVGNDSGLMHLAAAAGTPTLGLFGPTPAHEYAPAGRRTATVIAEGPEAAAPMTALSVEKALQAAPDPTPTMRMAHTMAGAPAGGAELFFERITTALTRTQNTVLPIIRRDPARAARLQLAGLTPIQLRFGGPLDLLTPRRLTRHLRAFAPTLVMAWMSRAAAATPRGDYILTARLGGYYDLRRFRHCDHLIANTRGLVQWIQRQGWPSPRTHHLPNFVPDLAGIQPATLPVPPGAPTVLAMGRLHRNKAFDILIRALRQLPNTHLVLAGEGPERAALQRLAKDEGMASRVHLLGWRADQAALLAACTLLCVPSRQEPLGNVVLEAFSAGKPVVATMAEGPLELIRPGQTGLLTPLENPDALAQAIHTLITNPTLAAQLATAARATFEAEHAEAPVVARWQTVLASLERT